MDVDQRALWREGQPVSLTPKEFDTLLALVETSGQLVGKETIVSRVWPDTFVADSSLTRNISVLRRALGEGVIETVPKFGYRLALPVIVLPKTDALSPSAVGLASQDRETHSQFRRRWLGVAAVAACLAVGSYLARLRLFPRRPTPAGRAMLIVLPFQNLSGDPSHDYLTDGLTDELTTEVARLSPEQLGVIAESSATAYKHTNKRVDQIAKEVGVNYVLEGGLLRVGDRVRVNAQLVDASDQSHVWAETYERNLGDTLGLENEIAKLVAGAVQLKLTRQQSAQLASVRPANSEAHEAYLVGRYYWNQRTHAGYESAAHYFRRAIEKDPQYAAAYAGLAESIQAVSKADRLAAAMKAVELDPASGEAHTALAFIRLFGDLDLAAAEFELKRAIQFDPNYATAHHWYAGVLEAKGDFQGSASELRQAVRLDPLSLIIRAALADTLSLAGQNDAAVAELQRVLAMNPNFSKAQLEMGIIDLRKGMYPQAIHEFQASMKHGEEREELMGVLGYTYARSGKRTLALKMLGDLQRLQKSGGGESGDLAIIEIGLGNPDQALFWLEKAYDERDDYLLGLKVNPMFDPLRSDPRFLALERRVGLLP